MLIVDNIHKSYGSVTALSGVSFEAGKGEIFGIIGPDGAGKTTLFRIMTTLLLADKGECQIDGMDVVKKYREIRKSIGYMPGRFSLYQDLSVKENLTFFASVFRTTVKENYHLIKDIYEKLEPFSDRRAGKLSGGMKQKLALCCALIHKPNILFLDEPTTGVDPVSRKEFWVMLKRLQEQGITIIVSTPYMDEATLCDRIALIKNGQFMSINTPQEVINRFDTTLYAARSKNMYRLLSDIRSCAAIENCYVSGDFHHFTTKEEDFDIEEFKTFLQKQRHENILIEQIEANIEDCYMRLSRD